MILRFFMLMIMSPGQKDAHDEWHMERRGSVVACATYKREIAGSTPRLG